MIAISVKKRSSSWMVKLFSCVGLLSLLFAGCSSTTLIKTDPPGAALYIDGVKQGVTPYSYSDSSTFFTPSRDIVLKKEGYKNLSAAIRKSEVTAGTICRSLLGVPVLWITIYPEEYNFELEK
jgi:hypothetical protein